MPPIQANGMADNLRRLASGPGEVRPLSVDDDEADLALASDRTPLISCRSDETPERARLQTGPWLFSAGVLAGVLCFAVANFGHISALDWFTASASHWFGSPAAEEGAMHGRDLLRVDPSQRFAFVQMVSDAEGAQRSHEMWSALATARAVRRLSRHPYLLLTNVKRMPSGSDVARAFSKLGARVLPLPQAPLPANVERLHDANGQDAEAVRSEFLRLNIWRLTDYKGLIWLDADTILFRSLDWLFSRPAPWGQSADPNCSLSQPSQLGSGFLYVEPSETDLQGLLDFAAGPHLAMWRPRGVLGLVESYFQSVGRPVRFAAPADASSGRCLGRMPSLPGHTWRLMPAVIRESSEDNECFGFDVARQLQTVGRQVASRCQRHPLGSYWRDAFCDAWRIAGEGGPLESRRPRSELRAARDYCDDSVWFRSFTGAEPDEPAPGAPRPRIRWPTTTLPTTTTTATTTRTSTESLDDLCNGKASEGSIGPPPRYGVSDETNDRCFGLVNSSLPDLTKGGKDGRNWCWVGLKGSGCHTHLFEHFSWEEEMKMAVEANATINTTFQPLRHPHICDRPSLGKTQEWSEEDLKESAEWFNRTVAVHVLSLPSSKERLEALRDHFGKLRLNYTVVWGVDVRKHDAMRSARKEGLIPSHFNHTIAQFLAREAKNGMSVDGSISGTIGCAAGHFRAQRRAAAAAGRSPLAVVFEDDARPAEDFVPRLWRLVTQELPCDWQVVSLASRCPFGTCVAPHLSRVQPDVNEPEARCRHGVNYGFQGVLYRATTIPDIQPLWQSVVFDHKRPHCLDVDVALASISDSVSFYAVPASQAPGMLEEEWTLGSTRLKINKAPALS